MDVATGTVAFAASELGPLEDVFAVAGQVGTKTLEGLGAKLSVLARKRIGTGGSRDVKAVLAWSEALTATDAGQVEQAKAAFTRALAADPSFARAKSQLEALEGRVGAIERRLDVQHEMNAISKRLGGHSTHGMGQSASDSLTRRRACTSPSPRPRPSCTTLATNSLKV